MFNSESELIKKGLPHREARNGISAIGDRAIGYHLEIVRYPARENDRRSNLDANYTCIRNGRDAAANREVQRMRQDINANTSVADTTSQ